MSLSDTATKNVNNAKDSGELPSQPATTERLEQSTPKRRYKVKPIPPKGNTEDGDGTRERHQKVESDIRTCLDVYCQSNQPCTSETLLQFLLTLAKTTIESTENATSSAAPSSSQSQNDTPSKLCRGGDTDAGSLMVNDKRDKDAKSAPPCDKEDLCIGTTTATAVEGHGADILKAFVEAEKTFSTIMEKAHPKSSDKSVGCPKARATEPFCAHCYGKDQLMKCVKCKKVFYCSRSCQSLDWKAGHKEQCKTLADKSAAQDVKSPAVTAHSPGRGKAPV